MARQIVEIPLTTPVIFDGVRYETLRAREAKPRDLGKARDTGLAAVRAAQAAEIENVPEPSDPNFKRFAFGLSITARLCGVPPAVICLLDPADEAAVGVEVRRFIARVL